MGYLRNLAYRVMASPPILSMGRRHLARGGITVFMYHDIGEDREDIDVWQIVRRSDFQRQIDYLRQHYELVSLDHALEAIQEPPTERPLAVLTFDDGHRGNIEHLLPIVQREQLPVTLYIATGHVETGQPYWFDRLINHLQTPHPVALDLTRQGLGTYRFGDEHGARNWARMQQLLVAIKALPVTQCDRITDEIVRQLPQVNRPALSPLTPAEVGELSRTPGVVIGAHTNGHEVLTKLSLTAARDSILESVTKLSQWTGAIPRHFAYPAGFHNPDLMELVEDMGFASAMSTESGIWQRGHSRFRIPRIAVGRYDHLDTFRVNALRR